MRRNLLSKVAWDYHDICIYCDVKKSKAYQIMKIVREKFNGNVRFNKKAVYRDSVLEYLGTTIERETYVKECIENDKKI